MVSVDLSVSVGQTQTVLPRSPASCARVLNLTSQSNRLKRPQPAHTLVGSSMNDSSSRILARPLQRFL